LSEPSSDNAQDAIPEPAEEAGEGQPSSATSGGDAIGDTAGTGTIVALGCIAGTIFIIILGLIYLLITQLLG